ncbi:MAG: hypothetical protein H6604_01355 [Flavobacteriales bacterium]|nr:hypothetical protein [Flavobacteriales bacterium]
MKTILKTEFLILIFLWINVIISFINLPQAEIFMIVGIIGLTVTSVLYKFNNKISVLILIILLAFGAINLVSFNDSIQVNFMGFINIVNLLLFVILIYKKRNVLSELNKKWLEPTKEDYVEQQKNQIQFFKKRFENLKNDELRDKLNDKLVDEAKEAILQILHERK